VTRHSGPDFEVPPDDQRCEALIRGKTKSAALGWQWMMVDHRCPRRANQTRMGRSVCWQHGAVKTRKLKWFTDRRDSMADEPIPSPRELDAPFKKQVGTVDVTPLWIEVLPLLTAWMIDPDPKMQETAREELERMARAADGYNQLQRMVSDGMQKMGAALYELRDRARSPRSQETKDGE
jgi:hypothetical protein